MRDVSDIIKENLPETRIKIWCQDIKTEEMFEEDIVDAIYMISFERRIKYIEAIELIKVSSNEKPIKLREVILWRDS